MEILFLIIIYLIIIGIFILFRDKILIFSREIQQKEERLPYKKKDFLLNVPERIFFENLQQIIPNNYSVYPQVPLNAIVSVISTNKEFWTYQNKINKKVVDFVIFEKQYLKPVIVIEYDGKTHNRSDRQLRDSFVDKVLKSAEIKILHIKHHQNLNFKEIKNKLEEILINKKVET